MDIFEIFIIVGTLAFVYLVPPRWVKRLVSSLFGLKKPEDLGTAFSAFAEDFLSGHSTPEGEEISPGEMLMMYVQGAAMAAAMAIGPYLMEELPILIASARINNWSEEMQKKSAVASSVSRLEGKQYQAFQQGMSDMTKGIGKMATSGVIGEPPEFLKKIMGVVRAAPEIKAALSEFGAMGSISEGIPMGGPLPSDGISTPSPNSPPSYPASDSKSIWKSSGGGL